MYNDNGYNCISIPLENGKRYILREHKLNILINHTLKNVCENHIHHKNGCRIDNRVENLELLSSSKHTSLHHKGKIYKKNKKDYIRVVKNGFKENGKQRYALKYNGKVNKTSIYKEKLEKEVKGINKKREKYDCG